MFNTRLVALFQELSMTITGFFKKLAERTFAQDGGDGYPSVLFYLSKCHAKELIEKQLLFH